MISVVPVHDSCLVFLQVFMFSIVFSVAAVSKRKTFPNAVHFMWLYIGSWKFTFKSTSFARPTIVDKRTTILAASSR